MSKFLKGGTAAAALDAETEKKVCALHEKGIVPCLALLRVGEEEGALSYARVVKKRCDKLGIAVREVVLPMDASQEKLTEAIETLNRDSSVHGILLFSPLPESFDEAAACAALSPEKDVDGMTPASMAKVYSGTGKGFVPCTAASVMEMLRFYGVELKGKRAAVLGRSLVSGRPLSMLLMQSDATVTVCHRKTQNESELTRQADVVIVAVGQAESIGKEYFRPGQTVVDVGIHWSESKQKTVGDVAFDEVEPLVSAISPVPGGVGSMTAAVLASHVVRAAERIEKL